MSTNTILVIEDDADVRLGYQVLLKAHGYATCFAVDSLSAISEARKHEPDLIILDLGLPAGDGYIVLDRFRANMHLATTPVIVVSAREQRGNKERALEKGARAYLQKPWNDDVLLGLIRQLLGESVGSASSASASGARS